MARTITIQEIAVIEAMITHSKKNTVIQFVVDQPGQPVNSVSIHAVTDEELDAFLDARASQPIYRQQS